MNQLIQSLGNAAATFAADEEGAQVVEYALIIALVSIALAVALAGDANTGLRGAFTTLVARVAGCFTAGGVCA